MRAMGFPIIPLFLPKLLVEASSSRNARRGLVVAAFVLESFERAFCASVPQNCTRRRGVFRTPGTTLIHVRRDASASFLGKQKPFLVRFVSLLFTEVARYTKRVWLNPHDLPG